MIAVIIGSILLMFGIIFLVAGFCIGDDVLGATGIILFMCAVLIIVLPLYMGKSIYKQNNTDLLYEKESIEYLLENNPTYHTYEKAKEYNDKIDNNNNYFCRFNKEDRSEFKINLDKYIITIDKETNNESN